MMLFNLLFVSTIVAALMLGYVSVKHKWKIADLF
jgi:hypothetical protein